MRQVETSIWPQRALLAKEWWVEKSCSGDLKIKNEPQGSSKSILSKDQLRAKMRAYSQFEALQQTGVSAVTGERVKMDLRVFS